MELEREAEREALAAALECGAAGRGQLVVVEGPPGIGKSHLLDMARAEAGEHGLEVLSARGSPLEGGMPFGLVIELFAPVLRKEGLACFEGAAALAEPLFTPGGPATLERAGDGFALVHGLYWLLVGLAERAPRLVIIDNMQWVDGPSTRFLAYLADRLEGTAVTAIVGLRTGMDPADPDALRLIRNHPRARVLAPAPLSVGAVCELVRSAMPDADDALCAAVHDSTGGNPFLANELLVALRREYVESGPAARRLIERLAPEAVVRAIDGRLAAIPDGAALAQAVAVLGAGTTLGAAAAVTGIDTDAAARVAERLRDAGLLHQDESLRFANPLERLAVYQSIGPSRRAAMHRRAFDELRREDAGVAALVPHMLNAPRSGDAELVRLLREAAARSLAAGEPATSARYLSRALAEPPPAAVRGDVLVEVGRAEALAGDPGALAHLRQGFEVIDDPEARAEVLLAVGRELQLFGHDRQAAEAFAAGRTAAHDCGDESLALRLLAGQVMVSAFDPANRQGILDAAFAAVPAANGGSDPEHWELFGVLAFEALLAGHPSAEVIELAKRALARGKLLGELGPAAGALHRATTALALAGAFAEAEEALDQAVEDAECRGLATAAAHVLLRRAVVRYQRGALLDSIADAERALTAERHGSGPFLSATRGILAVALLERNELHRAAACLEQAREDVAERGASLDALLLWARAEIQLAQGAYDQAAADARAAGQVMIEGLDSRSAAVVPWRSTAARALVSSGDRDAALQLAAEELEAAEAFGAPAPVGLALMAMGMAERGAASLACLERAVEVLAGSGALLHEARALGELGAALRRSGQTKEAQKRLRSALDLAERCGSCRLADWLQEELKACGVRPRRRALTGPGALTPGEQRVARLAAEGATNREIAQRLFVSVKAVEWHLAHAYGKLGVQSRRQLAGALAG